MHPVRDTFCSFCGAAYAGPLVYPRRCPNPGCGIPVWANPVPVSVVLLPLEHAGRTGLVVLRRGIEPQRGRLALPGGFLEDHESWQVGGARELDEELGLSVDPGRLEPFWFASSEPRPNRVLLFGVAPVVQSSSLPGFVPNTESTERGAVFGPEALEDVAAFSLHTAAMRRWFAAAGITGPHGYTAL